MKERLTQQLLDGYLRSYLMDKEHWNSQHFESIDWIHYSSAFKRSSKGRQTAVSKATHNLWHTETRHQKYYGGAKPFCMCNYETEDWRNVIMCGSLDSSLHREAAWEKLINSMEWWNLPPDFWTTIKKCINYYKEHHTNAHQARPTTNHINRSELHSPHQGTFCSRDSGHNHTQAGTIL
jgi:hypothetical protein